MAGEQPDGPGGEQAAGEQDGERSQPRAGQRSSQGQPESGGTQTAAAQSGAPQQPGEGQHAAEQGDGSAQTNLGFMYHYGQGVPQDYLQAHMWYNLAISRFPPGAAHDDAVRNRDFVAKHMTPAQIAEAQRLAREWKPKK